ncbi:hypothetical protein Tco_0774329 [Tanacetum coccineum]|uniref:Uncharacterized protein n=1 Tax=Tanacetum coccineum TaxID=301880 RepID=A0ABQ4ZN74_9ASTR
MPFGLTNNTCGIHDPHERVLLVTIGDSSRDFQRLLKINDETSSERNQVRLGGEKEENAYHNNKAEVVHVTRFWPLPEGSEDLCFYCDAVTPGFRCSINAEKSDMLFGFSTTKVQHEKNMTNHS